VKASEEDCGLWTRGLTSGLMLMGLVVCWVYGIWGACELGFCLFIL
jgi:hypothetical protein